MSRFYLDEKTMQAIDCRLPDISPLQGKIKGLSPDRLSFNFPVDSRIPIAAVCFDDASDILGQAYYALWECYAHGVYYREKTIPANEALAVHYERYYIDDVALRLYAAGEHLASAITDFMEISAQDLAPYQENRISKQNVVGNYLKKKKPGDPVTVAVKALVQCGEWRLAQDYRNRWVHDQPPTVKGLGLTYHRKSQWQSQGNGFVLNRDGDEPEYKTEDLIKNMDSALRKFHETLDACFQHYLITLKNHGVKVSYPEQNRIEITTKRSF